MWVPDTGKNLRGGKTHVRMHSAEANGMKEIPADMAGKIKANIKSVSVDILKT